MLASCEIRIQPDDFRTVWSHVLPTPHRLEEAAFLYCRPISNNHKLECIGFDLMASGDYAIQLPYHFELGPDALGRIIKRAHDLGATPVELHSHLGDGKPAFSPSDVLGFKEVVPYVRWRLAGRPYGAIVTNRTGFVGRYWSDARSNPSHIATIRAGDSLLHSAGTPRQGEAPRDSF